MKKLFVKHFGPITGEIELDTSKSLTILIGEQGTGKSTLSKLVFYFETALYRLCDYILEERSKGREAKEPGIKQHLREDFESWLTPNGTKCKSIKCYDDPSLHTVISANNKYVVDIETIPNRENEYNQLFSSLLSKADVTNLYKSSKCVYIPADRSFFPKILDSFNATFNYPIEAYSNHFLRFISTIRSCVGNNLEVALDKHAASLTEENMVIGRKLIDLYKRIYKGTYAYRTREYIIVNKNITVPLVNASSGQQAANYLLLTLFYIFLKQEPYLIIVEEPEAHVFPAGQELIMEFIVQVVNATGSRAIITTHSPYILTATNPLILRAKVAKETRIKDHRVLAGAQIEGDNVNALFLYREKNNVLKHKNIKMDLKMIDISDIDGASNIINKKVTDIIQLGGQHGINFDM